MNIGNPESQPQVMLASMLEIATPDELSASAEVIRNLVTQQIGHLGEVPKNFVTIMYILNTLNDAFLVNTVKEQRQSARLNEAQNGASQGD